MSETTRTHKAPDVVERFLKALVVANKAVALYPPSSTIPRETSEAAAKILREALQERSDLVLGIIKEGMTFDGVVVLPARSAYTNFAIDLYNRHLAEVRFHVGAGWRDILAFLSILKDEPDRIEAAGGFESRLWEQGVTAITITEVRVTIVDVHTPKNAAVADAPTRAEVDEALRSLGGSGSRPRERVLARFFGNPAAIAAYLTELHERGGSHAQIGTRLALLAKAARQIDEDRTEESGSGGVTGGDGTGPEIGGLRGLADALACVDVTLRSSLMLDEFLPEARTNEDVAVVLRQFPADDLLRMAVSGADAQNPPVGRIARSVRQIGELTAMSVGDVAAMAGVAMEESGFSEEAISQVLTAAAPERVTVETPGTRIDNHDHAGIVAHAFEPLSDEELEQLPEMARLREEAAGGITDGDVVRTLVLLISSDDRDGHFDSTVAALEQALEFVVRHGQIDAAADAVEQLGAIAGDPRFSDSQRERIDHAVSSLAKPSDMLAIVRAMRAAGSGSEEHTAAGRLLDSLGERAIGPMIEQLAEEEDMAARKTLIDALSGVASRFLPEIGEYISDERWYVVRNVVSILGAARSSSAIPYLERTIRHSEPRVRRETIRALASIEDRFANQMLISALTDESAQNVQLAARYLGSGNVQSAIPALERVAKGEGHGNRDPGPRVEAIEALGRLRAMNVLPTLEMLARRSWFKSGRPREVRAAAVSAIEQIKTGASR